MSGLKARLIAGTAIVAAVGSPTFAQEAATARTSNSLDASSIQSMTAPRYSKNTPMGGVDYGDDLGDHAAEKPLDMSTFGIYNLADPTADRPDMAANKSYVDQVGAASRDNLGDHTATEPLDMNNFEIKGLSSPTTNSSAATKQYVDSQTADAKDNLGDHIATQALDMDGNKITDIGTPVNDTDAVNKIYVDQVGAASKDNLGDHTATTDLNMAGNKITGLAAPAGETDAASKSYVDSQSATINNSIADIEGRTITVGTGLTGGGPLSGDVTITFDETWGDTKYAPVSRTISAGDGLMGTGSLRADIILKVDSTVVRTTGDQTLGGKKRFTLGIHNGGRPLEGVATPVRALDAANKDYVDIAVAAAALTPGSGLTVTGGTIDLDDTVVRTTGAQTISGVKTFSANVQMGNYKIRNLGAPMDDNDATTRIYVDDKISTEIANNRWQRGYGLTLSTGRQVAVDPLVIGTLNHDQTFVGVKTFAQRAIFSAGQNIQLVNSNASGYGFIITGTGRNFSIRKTADGNAMGGPVTPSLLVIDAVDMRTELGGGLQVGGDIRMQDFKITSLAEPTLATDAATKGYVDAKVASSSGGSGGVPETRTISAGTGLTGGGSLSANRTFSFDTTWGDQRYVGMTGNQTISGIKTFSNVNVHDGVTNGSAFVASIGANDEHSLKFMSFLDGGRAANYLFNVVPAGTEPSFFIANTDGSGGSQFEFTHDGRISGVSNPVSMSDVTNKEYVDTRGRVANDTTNGFLEYNADIKKSGAFYNGAVNPTDVPRLNYDGYFYATRFYSSMYLYFSDRNLKENIETIAPHVGIETVRKANPVSYNWKDSGHKALGLIAQEVEEIIPTAVKTNEAGIKSVDYVQMIAPMLAAIQDLDMRAEASDTRANDLMAKSAASDAQIQDLIRQAQEANARILELETRLPN